MKRGRIVLLILLLICLSSLAWAEGNCIYYFYGKDCPTCEETDAFLANLTLNYPELKIEKFEIYYNKDNSQLLQNYFGRYKVPVEKQGLPAVFLAKGYLVGYKAISSFLEKTLASEEELACPTLDKAEVLGITGEKSPRYLIETLTFGKVTRGAIKESFGKGTLAVWLILFAVLLAAMSSKKLRLAGIALICGVYLAFLSYGLGKVANWTNGLSFSRTIGGIMIFLGLGVILNSILWKATKEKYHLKREKIRWLLEIISFPVITLAIGFFSSLLVLGRGGETLWIIMLLLKEEAMRSGAIPLLAYYIAIFVLPWLAATLLIYFLKKKIEDYKKEKKFDFRREIELEKERRTKLLASGIAVLILVLGIVLAFF